MIVSLHKLEQLLRGEATSLPNLEGDRFDLPAGGLSILLTLLGMVYGACMGLFSLTAAGSGHGMQVLASTVKTPALFLLTLVVTFPSLYVFNAMFGSRLRLLPMLRLMVGSLAVTMAVLASIGPIVGFFGVSSTSYPFMVLLNVFVFAVSGVLGLGFLLQTLHRMDVAARPIAFEPPPLPTGEEFSPVEGGTVGALRNPDARTPAGSVRGVFRIWIVIFGLVGAQMAWVLRPFIGSPGRPFQWVRPVGGNFFESVTTQIQRVFGM